MDSLFNLNTSKNGDSKSVMKQAEQIWSMLDDMLETDQESYKYEIHIIFLLSVSLTTIFFHIESLLKIR
jgi:hypothetical protein